MSLYTVFYFEDNPQNASDFLAGMAEEVKDKIKIIWFSKAPPSPIPSKVHAPYCPLVFEKEDVLPKAYILEKGSCYEIPVTQYMWWQSEFDAAVLDIYGSNEVLDGLDYAKWFEIAGFIGPVVLVSFRNIPHLIHNRLPKITRLSKTTDPIWVSHIADIINDYYPLKFDSLLPSTGVFGFQKGTHIKKFQEFSQTYGKTQKHVEFHSLWVSETNDTELERNFLEFLCIKEHEHQLNKKSAIQREYPKIALDNLKQVLERFKGLGENSNFFLFRRPDIIFIDVGETLSAEHFRKIKDSIILTDDKGRIRDFYPLIGVFCEKTENITFEDFEEIGKYCISLISRNDIKNDPTIWAKKIIDKFSVCVNDLLTTQKIVKNRYPEEIERNLLLLDAKRNYVKYLLELLLFARSKSRIYSADNVASIVPWLSENPLETIQKFNTNVIGKMSREIRKELISKKALYESRAKGLKL